MAQYIDKSAVVAEIEERIKRNNEKAASYSSGSESDYLCRVKEAVYENLISFLNTLEVKEVNLEKEIESSMNNLCELGCYAQSLLDNPENYEFAEPFPKEVDDELANFAKHFFELGLKTQKGE